MSDISDRILAIIQEKELSYGDLSDKTGIPKSALQRYATGQTEKIPIDRLQKIASAIGTTPGYLMGWDAEPYNTIVFCNECGFQYNKDDIKSVAEHNDRHSAWRIAVAKFGFCWEHRYREEQKATARAVMSNDNTTHEEKCDAAVIVFKALFSRSLEASGYNLDHVDFPTYVSMILNQGKGMHGFPESVYEYLVNAYGISDGIEKGTYYNVTNKKAPVKDDECENDEKGLPDIYLTNSQQKMLFEVLNNACIKNGITHNLAVVRAKSSTNFFRRLQRTSLHTACSADILAVAEYVGVKEDVENILFKKPVLDNFLSSMNDEAENLSDESKEILLNIAKTLRKK